MLFNSLLKQTFDLRHYTNFSLCRYIYEVEQFAGIPELLEILGRYDNATFINTLTSRLLSIYWFS